MKVWLVFNSLNPMDEVEVFLDEQSALIHRKNLTKKWKCTRIVERELQEI